MGKVKHGLCNHPLYSTWQGMRERCNCPTADNYRFYGGRRITVCMEWDDFLNFYQWANNNGWRKGLTLDRIDNNLEYSPSNCRWVTVKEQCYNRRTNHYLVANGIKKTVHQWEEYFGFRKGIISKWVFRHDDEYAIHRICALLQTEEQT